MRSIAGIGGGAPGSAAPFVAACHFYFNALSDFERELTAHANELVGDIPNYTNIEPQIQVSEMVG